MSTAACPLNTTHHSPNFDVLVLSLVWPFSSCIHLQNMAGDVCQSPPVGFVVRGLWPARNSSHQPSCCGAGRGSAYRSNFNPAEIIDLAPQLRHVFPDLSVYSSPLRLWRLQWDVFGSCSRLTQRAFFRKMIELYRKFTFYRALSASGIVASDHRTHSLSSIQAVIEGSLQKRVHIFCQDSWKGTILDGINVCLDKRGGRVVDCPRKCTRGATKEQKCCEEGSRLTIPFWSREKGRPKGALNSSAPVDATQGGQAAAQNDYGMRGQGYWVGQVLGFIMVAGGVSFWIFKQSTLDWRRPTAASHDYQRIT